MCSRPNIFFIEPTNVCDLKCEMCPANREMKRPKGYMKIATFKSIVDYIAEAHPDETCFINMWGWGEPFLHDDIFDMIEYASGENIKTRVSTNFNSVTDTQIDDICSSALDSIIIGLDGIQRSSHQVYRVGSNINQLKCNVEKLTYRKRECKEEKPNIIVTTLVTSFSENEVSEIMEYCKGIGVDALLLKYPNMWRGKKSDAAVRDIYNKFIRDVTAGSRYTINTHGSIRSIEGDCPFAEMNGIFLYDGRLTVCCFDYDGENSLEAISDKKSVQDIYNSSIWHTAKCRMSQKDFNTCATCDSCGPRRKVFLFRKDGDDTFLAGL